MTPVAGTIARPPNSVEAEFITIAHAAQLIDASTDTIYRLVRSGALRSFKIPGIRARRVSRAELLGVCSGGHAATIGAR
jgi:excisionase family DNA binding protein